MSKTLHLAIVGVNRISMLTTFANSETNARWNDWLSGWLARAALPVEVTEEMVEAGVRSNWSKELALLKTDAARAERWAHIKEIRPEYIAELRDEVRETLTAALSVKEAGNG
jgi:hypothetical protein